MRGRRSPLPPEFAAQVRDVVARARTGGADVAEALNYKNLLLTPAAEQAAQLNILKALRDRLYEYEPHEMLRRKIRTGNPGSPADMYVAVREYLDEYIEHVRKGI